MSKALNFWRIVGNTLIIFLVVQACQRDGASLLERASMQQTFQTAHDNQEMIATVRDIAGVTAGAFSQQGITSGRIADEGVEGEMECEPSVTSNIKLDRTHLDTIMYSGVITVDYGTGANCPDSVKRRKGMVVDSFMLVIRFKDSVWYSLSEKIKFVGYSRDSTTLDGSISIASSSGSPTVVTIDETKVKYTDGKTSTWKGDLVYTIHNPGHNWGGTIDVTGSWSGTTRAGASFSAQITKAIEYKSTCYRGIPVAGTVQVTTNDVTSTIDYGDGTCDRIYTITTAGVTKEYKFSRRES
ncbi:MAG TPA: hypothetical protein VKQ08_11015 [Cyclobacteriaceae bacterium]|nr:hypothetical protein [Cyclobacteriaceae bacterium]